MVKKQELIDVISNDTNLSKADVTKVVNSFMENVKELTKKEGKVSLVGFGNFEARQRSAREGRNPLTGETIKIAAKTVPVFKPGKAFKDIF